MVGVICSGISDVVQHFFSIQPKSLGGRQDANRTESALGVDVQTLALATPHADRELTGNRKGVTQLGLSCSKFTEEFGYGTSFDTT
jgi:hypothetical protein